MTPTVLGGDVLMTSPMGLGAAIFSEDGRRRRWLYRNVSPAPRRCGFVMLNPSTADAFKPDNTITRCIGFAAREGCGALEVANLADIIETDSKKLAGLAARGECTDANSRHYLKHVLGCDLVILAWGGHPWARGKLQLWWMQNMGGDSLPSIFQCLGKTKAGAPNHPLYLAAKTPLEVWP